MQKLRVLVVVLVSFFLFACKSSGRNDDELNSMKTSVDSAVQRIEDSVKAKSGRLKDSIEAKVNRRDSSNN